MADYITKDQDALKISLNTGMDISLGSSFEIHYIKPEGERGLWTASQVEQRVEFSMTLGASEIDQAGMWTFWSKVFFADGSFAEGEPLEFKVYLSGEL